MSVGEFGLFELYLFSLEEQRRRLRLLNSLLESSVPEAWFDKIDTKSNHTQSIRDLEFLFIVPTDNFRDTLRYQLSLLELSLQTKIEICDEFDIDDSALVVNADRDLYKNAGIYRLRIDLLSGWDPLFGSMTDVIRQQTKARGVIIDGIPALGAYAAQSPRLFKSQNGRDLPYLDIADIQIGEGHDYVPCCFFVNNNVHLLSHHCELLSRSVAVPTRIHA